MGVEPSMCKAAVLVFADDVIHDIGQEASDHKDFHIIALPAVL